MGLMYKDVKLCLEEAEVAGVQMKIASAVRELWRAGNDELGADKDFTEVIRVLERRAGVEVKGGRNG